ncbi:MAG: prolipoprotein diacylglyceryl transferase, partial [Chloroflexota bacterium]|nr:prolipoprotein diacylglyceryl transferase [Chloroflexota bacterium]
LSALLGVGAGVWLFARGAPLEKEAAYGIALGAVFWGIVGARVFHVIDYAGFYADAPFRAAYLWSGGMALWGGLLGGGAYAAWRLRCDRPLLARTADAAALPVLIGMAVGRIGDFIVGERAAHATSLPWGVVYGHEDAAAYAGGAVVHPVAAYELLLDAALAAALWRLSGRLREGARFALAMTGYAAGRFLLSFARVDPSWGGLQQAQWIGLAVAIAGVYWLVRTRALSAAR